MTFVLTTRHTYSWPVKVLQPNPDVPGAMQEHEFTGRFRLVARSEAKAFDAQVATLPADEQSQAKHDFLKTVLIGWEGVNDDAERPVPFSPEALAQAMDFDPFLIGCWRAYSDSISGDAARLGN